MTRRTALELIVRLDITRTLVAAHRPISPIDAEQATELRTRAEVETALGYGPNGGGAR